jgi:hypothetical protein
VREKLLELMKELSGEGFVVREDEGWAIEPLDHFRHGKGLARAGDAEQNLMLFASLNAGEEFVDGAALIALRLVVAD